MGSLFSPDIPDEEPREDPELEAQRIRELSAIERNRQGRESLKREGVFVPDPDE